MGNHRLFARVAAEPERHRSGCSAAESRRIGQAAAGAIARTFQTGGAKEMSERADVMPMPEGEYIEKNRFAPLSFLLGLLGAVGLGLSVVGAFVSPHQFSFSWLFAFSFYFTILAGCFFWIIVHHVVDAEWSVVVRRQLENLAMLLAVMALFFIPIIIFRHHLYEWMNVPVGHDPILDSKRGYLNWHFFLSRSIFYFVFLFAPRFSF